MVDTSGATVKAGSTWLDFNVDGLDSGDVISAGRRSGFRGLGAAGGKLWPQRRDRRPSVYEGVHGTCRDSRA